MVRVDELDVLQAFVFGDEAIADDLDFGLVRYSLQVWVKDAAFGVESSAMAVAGSGGVEALGQFVLGFGGQPGLIFDDDDVVSVERVADEIEVVI